MNKINKKLFPVLVLVLFFASTDGFTYFHCSPSCDINNMSQFSFYQHMTPHFAPNLTHNFYFGRIQCDGGFHSLWECTPEFEINWWFEFSVAELVCPNFHKYTATSISECRLSLTVVRSHEYQTVLRNFHNFKTDFLVFCVIGMPFLLFWYFMSSFALLDEHKHSLLERKSMVIFFILVQLCKLSLIVGTFLYVGNIDEHDLEWLTKFRDNSNGLKKLCFLWYPILSVSISVWRFEISIIKIIQNIQKQKTL